MIAIAALVLGAIGVWTATAALVAVAALYGRDDEQEDRLAALERDRELGELPAEMEAAERRPIGFRRE